MRVRNRWSAAWIMAPVALACSGPPVAAPTPRVAAPEVSELPLPPADGLADAQLKIARRRARTGDFENALAALDRAEQRSPGNPLIALERAEVLLRRSGEGGAASDLAAAEASLAPIRERWPWLPRIRLVSLRIDEELGRSAPSLPGGEALPAPFGQLPGDESAPGFAHAAAGRDEEAVIEARAVAARPDALAHRILLRSLLRLHEDDAAREAIEARPEAERSAEDWFWLGNFTFRSGETEAALGHWERARELSPLQPETLGVLLEQDARARRVEVAEARMRDALRRSQAPRLLLVAATTALRAGRAEDAETAYLLAMATAPNELQVYVEAASFLIQQKRAGALLDEFTRRAERRPDSAGPRLVMGFLEEVSGDLDAAMLHYGEAIERDSESALAKNNLAYLLADRSEEPERAVRLAGEAVASLPNQPHVYDTLGWTLLRADRPAEAIEPLIHATANLPLGDPTVSLARHHLALAYEAIGEKELGRDAAFRGLADLVGVGGVPWLKELRQLARRLRE